MGIKQLSSKVIGCFLVIGIITILILSGPAQAFVLTLSVSDPIVSQGEKIKVNLQVDTGSSDMPSDLSNLTFILHGPTQNSPENFECMFSPDGTIISGCDGMEITKVQKSESGYCKSYGYGYGCSFEYSISIDSGLFDTGNYTTTFIINAKDKQTVKTGDNITINTPKGVCSIRAKNGDVVAEGTEFNKNKISFFIPLSKASNGEGYITAQDGRGRLTYKFTVDKLLIYSSEVVKVHVSGKYRIGGVGKFLPDSGIITLDRINNVTSFVGDKIQVSDMKVYFRRVC